MSLRRSRQGAACATYRKQFLDDPSLLVVSKSSTSSIACSSCSSHLQLLAVTTPDGTAVDARPVMSHSVPKAIPLCHAVQLVRSAHSGPWLSVLTGLDTGCIWAYDPLADRQLDVLFNSNGAINDTAVEAIAWVPTPAESRMHWPAHPAAPSGDWRALGALRLEGSRFVVGHRNGAIYVCDYSFEAEARLPEPAAHSAAPTRHESQRRQIDANNGMFFHVERQSAAGSDPRSLWRLGRCPSRVHALAFSRDGYYLAVAQANGY